MQLSQTWPPSMEHLTLPRLDFKLTKKTFHSALVILMWMTAEITCAIFQHLTTQDLEWQHYKLVSYCSFHTRGRETNDGSSEQNHQSEICKIMFYYKYWLEEEPMHYYCPRWKTLIYLFKGLWVFFPLILCTEGCAVKSIKKLTIVC